MLTKPYILCSKYPHHGMHSGYDRLTEFVGSAHEIKVGSENRIKRKLTRLIRRVLPTAMGFSSYDERFLFSEIAAMARASVRKSSVIHYLYPENQFWLPSLIRPGLRPKIVATFHQPESVLKKILQNPARLKCLDAAIVVSTCQLSFFTEILGPERVHFIPHGVDTEYFTPPVDPPVGPRKRLLFVGSWLRDLATLRMVADGLLAHDREIEIVIVTDPANHGIFKESPSVVTTSRVSDDELLELYRSSQLTILPLIDCTANNGLLESLACGTPAVVTDLGGVRDYSSASCAVFVPPNDSAAFVESIVTLLANVPLLDSMRQNARVHAMAYAWPNVGLQTRKIYEGLVC